MLKIENSSWHAKMYDVESFTQYAISLTDKVRVFYTFDEGSIPSWRTNLVKIENSSWHAKMYDVESFTQYAISLTDKVLNRPYSS